MPEEPLFHGPQERYCTGARAGKVTPNLILTSFSSSAINKMTLGLVSKKLFVESVPTSILNPAITNKLIKQSYRIRKSNTFKCCQECGSKRPPVARSAFNRPNLDTRSKSHPYLIYGPTSRSNIILGFIWLSAIGEC